MCEIVKSHVPSIECVPFEVPPKFRRQHEYIKLHTRVMRWKRVISVRSEIAFRKSIAVGAETMILLVMDLNWISTDSTMRCVFFCH